MRFAFALLLGSAAVSFLALGAPQITAVAARAVVFRGACFLKRDGNRLAPISDLAGLAAAPALQFAMLEFTHDPAGDPFLTG